MNGPLFPRQVEAELSRARAKHPRPLNSAHEGYAVLLEEFRELEAEVFKQQRDTLAMRAELLQIACVAQRMAEDLALL